ncbi:MAG: hypothetical protein J5493_02300 [Lachnospiraceae bacterium]|nr:hypothetical protein [Lachnospiraceae bacterium]
MKKIYRTALCLCLAAVLALSACGGSPAQTADGTYVKPVEPPETTAAPTEAATPSAAETDPATEPAETDSAAQTTAAPAPATQPSVISTGLAPGEGVTTAPSGETADPAGESTGDPAETTADPGETAAPSFPGIFTAEDLIFTYKGRTIQVDDVFVYTDFEEAWGSPRIEKAQACIGGGYDENYYFGDHLAVSTLGDTGEQVIYDIFIDEPGFTTAQGAEIGKTDRDTLHRIYGDPDGSFGRTDRYSAGEILVSFSFDGGILSGIDYNHTQN